MDNGEHAVLIDRVARQMSATAPSADLGARISERLDAVPQSHLGNSLAWRTAVGALVGVAAVATFVLTRTPAPAVPDVPTAVIASTVGTVAPVPNTVPVLPVRIARRSTNIAAGPSAQELAWMERRIPALDRVEALTMDRIEVDSIQPTPLAIHPLTVTTLVTEPIGGDRGSINR